MIVLDTSYVSLFEYPEEGANLDRRRARTAESCWQLRRDSPTRSSAVRLAFGCLLLFGGRVFIHATIGQTRKEIALDALAAERLAPRGGDVVSPGGPPCPPSTRLTPEGSNLLAGG
jgi:hypothetical protein